MRCIPGVKPVLTAQEYLVKYAAHPFALLFFK